MFDPSELQIDYSSSLASGLNSLSNNSVNPLMDFTGLSSQRLLTLAGETLLDAYQNQTETTQAIVYTAGSIFTNFAANAQISFGQTFDINKAEALGAEILGGNSGVSPNVQFLFDADMNGALGAYAKSTNTIYLNREFLTRNVDDPTAIGKVLVEETGHFLDAYANPVDSPGDEGDILARLVNKESLDTKILSNLKSENDTGFINVSGDLLPVEFSSSNWRVELYNNISRTGTPVVVQDWGDGNQGFSRDWGNGSPHWAINSDNFSLRATAQRYFAPGRHEIQTTSDDGVKVNIAGQTIIDRLVDQATVTNTGIFDAGNGGTFTVIVDYYERGGGANLNFTTRLLQQSDYAGNSISAARDIGILNSSRSFSDWVGAADTNDYYRFSVGTQSNFSLNVTGLSADADVQLLNSSGSVINSSTSGSTTSESITSQLNTGTYYVRVYPYGSANTNYSLSLNATAVGPTDSAGNSTSAARDIGTLNSSRSFSDWVGAADTNDYYRFSVGTQSNFSLNVTGLSADADVQLLNSSGSVINSSTSGSTTSESITSQLNTGTYYVRVFPYGTAETNYNLSLNATAVVNPSIQRLNDLSSKSTLNITEIREYRNLVGQLPNSDRAGWYDRLQYLTPYFNQRDNQSRYDGATQDNMCNVTTLASCLTYLGVNNPDSTRQFEDLLDSRIGSNRYDWNSLSQLATSFGVASSSPIYLQAFSSTDIEFFKNFVKNNWEPALNQGKAVMSSTWATSAGHIIRIIDVDWNRGGLIVDDPYGAAQDIAGDDYTSSTRNTTIRPANAGVNITQQGQNELGLGNDNFWSWSYCAKVFGAKNYMILG